VGKIIDTSSGRRFKNIDGQIFGEWMALWPVCFKTDSKAVWSCQRRDGLCRLITVWRLRQHTTTAENTRKSVEYLSSHPCVDCGQSDPLVLDYDHITGTKARDVSQMIQAPVKWQKIAEEIKKCAVRCANCHRRRTFKDTLKSRTIADLKQGTTDKS